MFLFFLLKCGCVRDFCFLRLLDRIAGDHYIYCNDKKNYYSWAEVKINTFTITLKCIFFLITKNKSVNDIKSVVFMSIFNMQYFS